MLQIGYARVSKSDGVQAITPQRDALLSAGIDPERIYGDIASGRNDARPGLKACLKALQPGNTLVLWKFDRLGRDLRHLVNTVEDLRVRGIHLKVLAGAGAEIDTTTANGRLAFGIFAAFAEFERELIAERTQAGLADHNAVAADVARRLGMTTTTLYTYINGDGSLKAPGQAPCLMGRRTMYPCSLKIKVCNGVGFRSSCGSDCDATKATRRVASQTPRKTPADGFNRQPLFHPGRRSIVCYAVNLALKMRIVLIVGSPVF